MARDNKLIQFLKGSSILVASNIILKAINFFLLPLYTKYLDPAELGVSDIVITFTSFIFPLLVLGLDSAFSAFFYEEKTQEHQEKVFNTLWFTLVATSMIPLALIIFSDKISLLIFGVAEYKLLISSALLSVSIQLWFLPHSLMLRMQNRMLAFGIINIASSLLMISLNVLFVAGFRWKAYALIGSSLCTHIFQLALYTVVTKEKLTPRRYDKVLRKAMLRFSLPLVPTVVAVWALSMSDRLIIKHFLGEFSVGIYGIGARFSSVIAIISNAVYTAYTAFAFNKKDDPNAKQQFRRVFSGFYLVMFIICFTVSLFGKEIVHIMTQESYYSASLILPGVLYAQLAYGIYTITGYGIAFTKKTVFFLIATVSGAVTCIVLNLMFLPRYGLEAAGHVNFISYSVMCTLGYIFAQRVYTCDYKIMRVTMYTLVSYITVTYALESTILFKLFIWVVIVFVACYVFRDVIRDLFALCGVVKSKLCKYRD